MTRSLFCLLLAVPLLGQTPTLTIDATQPATAPRPILPDMRGTSPSGHELAVNSRYLTLDGKPWLPVMGEMHFSRYPEKYWEEEILKMKANGVKIVATYVFWIHHEEIEGEFDWSGRRDLRRFVELCAKHGLYVWTRIGPWAHGECRNGGFPDWLLKKGPTRENNPVYLGYVKRYYGEVAKQLQGLYWKDGGPVIGVQIENEYGQRGPNKGAAHYSELKRMAREAGVLAPFYSLTGWGNPDFRKDEFLAVSGGYADGFWDRSLEELPPSDRYRFSAPRTGPDAFPFLTAEMGGGMQVAYHRRPVILPDDVPAMTLATVGSGVALYGYYMFHGGSNPEGKLSTMQESQETGYPNDLPVVSYDFQAPLRQYGQMAPSFRPLKAIHLFLAEVGSDLAAMTTYLPDRAPKNATDVSLLRAAARMAGDRGFLFVNNYQRIFSLPERKQVQIALKLPGETVTIPRKPVDVPSGAYFAWPVNMEMNGVRLRYATAEYLCRLAQENTYFFFAWPGMPAEFAFDSDVDITGGSIERASGRVYVSGIVPGAKVAITATPKHGAPVKIVLLSREQALDAWKAPFGGAERLVLTRADVFFDSGRMHLRARDTKDLAFAVFPALPKSPVSTAPLTRAGQDGLFARYSVRVVPRRVAVSCEKTRDAAPPVPAKISKKVAVAPSDADFERAGVWKIHLPKDALRGLSDLFLRIQYTGDVGRVYAGNRLVDDNFFNGTAWEIGLKQMPAVAMETGFELKLLPLQKTAPIYIPRSFWPPLPDHGGIAEVKNVEAVPEYEVTVGQ